MDTHVTAEIGVLADLSELVDESPVNGWRIDSWMVSEEARSALRSLYQALLVPSLDPGIVADLEGDGINVQELLVDPGRASERITRADMTELAAGASLMAKESVELSNMHFPNVPKGQRDISERGIDIFALSLTSEDNDQALLESEFVVLCSVKHTLSDCGDLRRKLVASLELDKAYLTSQLRVLHGRLLERGTKCDRVFTVLSDTTALAHLRFVAVAAVDLGERESLAKQLSNLPVRTDDNSTFRQIFFVDLGSLQEGL